MALTRVGLGCRVYKNFNIDWVMVFFEPLNHELKRQGQQATAGVSMVNPFIDHLLSTACKTMEYCSHDEAEENNRQYVQKYRW